jgi:transposase
MIQTQSTPYLLSDRQWQLIQNVLPSASPVPPRGRPLLPDRACLDGVLYVIVNSIPWICLPAGRYPSYATCFRRYTVWVKNGVWDALLTVLFDDLALRTGVDLWHEWSSWSLSNLKHGRNSGRYSSFRLPEGLNTDEYDHIVGMLFLRSLSAMLEDDKHRRVKL